MELPNSLLRPHNKTSVDHCHGIREDEHRAKTSEPFLQFRAFRSFLDRRKTVYLTGRISRCAQLRGVGDGF
jgi:hypothetical protein